MQHRWAALPPYILVILGSLLPAAAAEDRQPFSSPLTPSEQRFLLDRQEAVQSGQTRPETVDAQAQVSPELLQSIQRSLGGSVVDQYPTLRDGGPPREHHRTAEPRGRDLGPDSRSEQRIAALQEAAWRLDMAAHHLEMLDLFEQADALRGQANRLRLDARRMIHGEPKAPSRPDAASPPPDYMPSEGVPPIWNEGPGTPVSPSPLGDSATPSASPIPPTPADPPSDSSPTPELAPQPAEPAVEG